MDDKVDLACAHLDDDEVLDLALTLGQIDSPSGHEHRVAEYIEQWCQREGFVTKRVRYDEHHAGNVLARHRGTGGGASVIFNSHMDTAVQPGDRTYFSDPDDPVFHTAWRYEDDLVGIGVVNDKGPMAAWMMAAAAIRRSGIELRGDLLLSMVTGEIGFEPVDEFQGPRWHGKDLGTRYLVTHGGVADYAIVAETTGFHSVWSEAGKAFLKVTVNGRANGIYTPYLDRPYQRSDEPNAAVIAARLIPALDEWALDWERRNTVDAPGGRVAPTVNIGAIRAGHPAQPILTPSECRIFLDVRLPPGHGPLQAQRELRELLITHGVRGDVEVYLFRRGYTAQGAEPVVAALDRATRHEIGDPPPLQGRPVASSMWRDLNVFNEVGIPAVTFGPGMGTGGGNRGLKVAELIAASKVFLRTAIELCDSDSPS